MNVPPMQSLLHNRLLVVCHQVRTGENLGAIARLMANFGFSSLLLAEPHLHEFEDATKMAVDAQDILEGRQTFPTLEQALASCVYAVGTTSRDALKGRTPLDPEAGVARLVEQSERGAVALVLGGEKRGLSDADLALCQDVLCIPTQPKQPSMNLSQSAAVLLYLAARASGAARLSEVLPPPGANLATLNALEIRLEEALGRAGFLNPQAPQHVLKELMRTLARANLTQREAELWLTAAKHLDRAQRG